MNRLDVEEDNLYLISLLDYTQELAVKKASNSKTLIINGSSDINMSVIIANIITNNLYTGKKVLLLSKDPARFTDVYEELTYLKEKILLLSNSDVNLDDIYIKIDSSISNLSKNTGMTTLSKISVLSRDINKKLAMLENIYQIFNTTNSSGLTLLDMYRITGNKLKQDDNLYDYYKTYRIRKPFINYTYDELNKCVCKLLNESEIDKYIKYRRFINNKLFAKLRDKVDKDLLVSSKLKINSLLNNEFSFESPLVNSKYSEDFVLGYLNNNKLNSDDIKKLSSVVNLKYNSSLINNKKGMSKWNPIYLINYASIRKRDIRNRLVYETYENTIYSEYVENLKNIKDFISEFDFIKTIINEDEYQNFLNDLLLDNDISEYLTNLLNILDVYEGFINVTKDANFFSSIEINVLTYCYDSMERKDEIKTLLKALPSFYLYYSIEEIETKEKETLNFYKNFEIVLKDIQLSVKTMNSFIPYGIKHIWDNKISESLALRSNDIVSITDYLYTKDKNIGVDNFFNSYSNIIFDMYPCCIATSTNLDRLDYKFEDIFDVIIAHEDVLPNQYISNENHLSKIIVKEEEEIILNNGLLDYDIINLNDKNRFNYSVYEDSNFISYLQREIFNTFNRLGYKIKINVKYNDYFLNLVFYKEKDILLIIECDDIIYTSNYKSKEIDLLTRNFFDSLDLCVLRVWSRDWWENKLQEVKRIESILEGLLLKF